MSSMYQFGPDLGLAPTVLMTSAAVQANEHASVFPSPTQQQTPPSQGNTPTHMSSIQTATQIQPHHQPRSVKRPRPVKSCTECRKRKLKCDRLCPCSQCQKSTRFCRYAADNDPANLSDNSEGEAELVRSPKRRRKSGGSSEKPSPSERANLQLIQEMAGRIERLERQLSRRPSGDVEYTGYTGWKRPIEVLAKSVRGITVKNGGQRTRYHGAASPRILLNLFDEAKDIIDYHQRDPEIRDVFLSFKKLHNLLRAEYQKSLKPISVFVDSMMPIQKRMVDILPKKPICDRLLAYYLHTNESVFRVIHGPTFKDKYDRYWEGGVPSEAFLPQLLCVLSTASRFETKSGGFGHERTDGVHLPTASALVRLWLNSARGKQLIDIETLQVELLLVVSCRMIREQTRDGWAQMGIIVRMAMDMGLHRDPSEFGERLSIFNGEMRRRLWTSCADLDYSISNECNLPCLLRDCNYTTLPPRNLNDTDIWPEMKELPPGRPFDVMTDNHLQAYAATTLGVRLQAASLLHRMDTIKDWSEIIEVGSKLERHIADVNTLFPRHRKFSNSHDTDLWRTTITLDRIARNPLVHLYRPFALGGKHVPSQITRGYLRSAVALISYLDDLDPSHPDFAILSEMCHVTLKADVTQAAMSVCYYIRSALRPNLEGPASGSVQQALRMSPDLTHTPDSMALWSIPQLMLRVERVVEFLVQNIKRSDTKDIVCLAVVLESVKSMEPDSGEVAHSMRVLLDSCLRAANLSLERLSSVQSEYPKESHPNTPHTTQECWGTAATGLSSTIDHDGWVLWEGWDWS